MTVLVLLTLSPQVLSNLLQALGILMCSLTSPEQHSFCVLGPLDLQIKLF